MTCKYKFIYLLIPFYSWCKTGYDMAVIFIYFFFHRLTVVWNSRSLPWTWRPIPSTVTYKSQLGGMGHGLRSTGLKIFCEEEVPGVFSTSVNSENWVKDFNTDQKWKESCDTTHRSKSQGKQLQRVKKREGEREGGQERAREDETISLDI